MDITLWGTRGSLAVPGSDTLRYGGNTSCVELVGAEGTHLVLDAGTGIRQLGATLPSSLRHVDVLLTHLHMDHIEGLPFFAPLYNPQVEVNIWAPARSIFELQAYLARYLSPPLFPVRLEDLPCKLHLHALDRGYLHIGEFQIAALPVPHKGRTLGYRISSGGAVMAYLPDHESAAQGTAGCRLAWGVDLLIHDTQYTEEEYAIRVGWGHSSVRQSFEFAARANVNHLVPFHHDPAHGDDDLDRLFRDALAEMKPNFQLTPGRERDTFHLDKRLTYTDQWLDSVLAA